MKSLFTFLLITYGAYCSMAQISIKTSTTVSVSVPDIVKKAFAAEFPTLQATWEPDQKNYKAIYADPKSNSKGIIIYDAEGKVIRRDTEVNTNSQPE